MIVFTAQLTVQFAMLGMVVANPQTYREAYQQAEARQQPLLVLVGSDSSPESGAMKTINIPALQRTGQLSDIAYAYVDRDAHPEMAQRLAPSGTPTQLVLYTRVGTQWRRSQLAGAASPTDIRVFLDRSINASATETSVMPAASQVQSWTSGSS